MTDSTRGSDKDGINRQLSYLQASNVNFIANNSELLLLIIILKLTIDNVLEITKIYVSLEPDNSDSWYGYIKFI